MKRRRQRMCLWCGTAITKAEATVEHLVPLSLGGPNEPWNLALACGQCNSRRGSDVRSDCVQAKLAAILAERDIPVVWQPVVSAIVDGRYDEPRR